MLLVGNARYESNLDDVAAPCIRGACHRMSWSERPCSLTRGAVDLGALL